MIDVCLTWYEVAIGAYIGVQRQIHALAKGRPDRHGFDGDGWGAHIEGACGEMAFAKAAGVYWSAPVNNFKGGDVGKLQIKTRSDHSYDLLVRRDDSDEDIFVLVTGCAPKFSVHGWLYGKDAKKPQYEKTYGDRPAAWFVPKEFLNQIDTMPESRATDSPRPVK